MDVIGSISRDYVDYDYPDVAGSILGYGVGSNVWDVVGAFQVGQVFIQFTCFLGLGFSKNFYGT